MPWACRVVSACRTSARQPVVSWRLETAAKKLKWEGEDWRSWEAQVLYCRARERAPEGEERTSGPGAPRERMEVEMSSCFIICFVPSSDHSIMGTPPFSSPNDRSVWRKKSGRAWVWTSILPSMMVVWKCNSWSLKNDVEGKTATNENTLTVAS